jgi:hypothetical protein
VSAAKAPIATLAPAVAALRSWADDLPVRRAPIIIGLTPDHLIERGDRIAVRRAANVMMGHPLVAFGDFRAGLMLRTGRGAGAPRRRLLDACVEGYISTTGEAYAGADELGRPGPREAPGLLPAPSWHG